MLYPALLLNQLGTGTRPVSPLQVPFQKVFSKITSPLLMDLPAATFTSTPSALPATRLSMAQYALRWGRVANFNDHDTVISTAERELPLQSGIEGFAWLAKEKPKVLEKLMTGNAVITDLSPQGQLLLERSFQNDNVARAVSEGEPVNLRIQFTPEVKLGSLGWAGIINNETEHPVTPYSSPAQPLPSGGGNDFIFDGGEVTTVGKLVNQIGLKQHLVFSLGQYEEMRQVFIKGHWSASELLAALKQVAPNGGVSVVDANPKEIQAEALSKLVSAALNAQYFQKGARGLVEAIANGQSHFLMSQLSPEMQAAIHLVLNEPSGTSNAPSDGNRTVDMDLDFGVTCYVNGRGVAGYGNNFSNATP